MLRHFAELKLNYTEYGKRSVNLPQNTNILDQLKSLNNIWEHLSKFLFVINSELGCLVTTRLRRLPVTHCH